MKVAQLIKVSAVALALSAMPLHAAFANDGDQGNDNSGSQSQSDTRGNDAADSADARS